MKARGFWNDGDGMTADDLEKVMLLVLSCACVITCLISYFLYQDITPNLTNLTLGIVGLMVTRKGISMVTNRYYGKNASTAKIKANNPEQYNPYNTSYGYNNYNQYETGYYNNGYNQQNITEPIVPPSDDEAEG